MLEEIFAAWLWPQLNLCNVVCLCQVIFVSKIYKKYQDLITLEKMFLLNK